MLRRTTENARSAVLLETLVRHRHHAGLPPFRERGRADRVVITMNASRTEIAAIMRQIAFAAAALNLALHDAARVGVPSASR